MRRLITFLTIFFVIHSGYSQSEFHDIMFFDSLNRYEIVDTTLIIAIDSALKNSESCPCVILKKHFFVLLTFENVYTFEDSTIQIEILPYNVGVISKFRESISSKKGFFYHKNILVAFKDDNDMSTKFLKNTGIVEDIYFQWDQNIINLVYPANNSFIGFYHYDGCSFSKIDYDGRECDNTLVTYYIIKENDTWQEIANLLNVKMSDLTDSQNCLPEKNSLIVIIQYLTKNNFVETIRVQ